MRKHARKALPAWAVVAALVLAGCSADSRGAANVDPQQVDATSVPELGACRMLTPDDVAEPSNATKTVPCTEPHTAETFAIGPLPGEFDDAAYDDREIGAWAYHRCSDQFRRFLGADDSLVMRTVLSWAWFRPSEKAWEDGARWYRCDVVGGGEHSETYVELPKTARGLLQTKPEDRDQWMVCADGPSVQRSPRVPCSEPHTWRAVTTIKVGEPDDAYPGDRLVEVTSRDYCSESVGAWLGYPPEYDFGYTWFGEPEWKAGNRRSVCWAKTKQ